MKTWCSVSHFNSDIFMNIYFRIYIYIYILNWYNLIWLGLLVYFLGYHDKGTS